jgi:hypothetical protein
MTGRAWRRPISLSTLSWAGVIFRAPEPNLVRDNWDLGPAQRAPDPAPDHPRVPRVVGMDRDGHVARDRLGPRGGHLDELPRGVGELVAHLVERPVDRLHDDLLVGERGKGRGAPVHHALAAVDAPAPVELRECSEDGTRIDGVHRELGPVPVARGPEPAQLLQDHPALLVAPFPDALDELLPAEVVAGLPLLAKFALHDRVGRDARVVEARNPESRAALQARPAHQDVLDRVVQDVPDREDPRHVRGRHHDRVALAPGRRPGREGSRGEPRGVPLPLDLARLVTLCDLGHEGEEANRRVPRQASPGWHR